jgi:hypothetical protein
MNSFCGLKAFARIFRAVNARTGAFTKAVLQAQVRAARLAGAAQPAWLQHGKVCTQAELQAVQ